MSHQPTSQPTRRVHRSVAREAAAGYEAGGGPGLDAAVDSVVSVPIDELDDTQIHAELAVNDRAVKRLAARNGELAAALASRQARRLRDADPDQLRTGQHAEADTAAQLQDELHWTRAQARGAMRTAEAVQSLPDTRDALRDGQISDQHAKVIADTLKHLWGDTRQALQAELLDAARVQDPVAFGRTARRRLATLDPEAFERDHDRKRHRRFARTWSEPDGMVRLTAGLYGIEAETLLTAIDAFRTPDAPGDTPLRPEQRTADALAGALRAALDHGVDTTDHGSRPHVILVRRPDQPAEGPWNGPVPDSEADRTATDASVSDVDLDPAGVPAGAGRARPSVPAAVWRALVVRDGGCTWAGCDALPGWCDAAHRDQRFKDGAGNSLDELALACRRHHRIIDRLELVGRLIDGRIVWFRPDQIPRDGPDP